MEKQFHWTFHSAPRSLFEEEPMEKQFSFLFSDISGVLWRKKHLTSTFYKLCKFIMMTQLK